LEIYAQSLIYIDVVERTVAWSLVAESEKQLRSQFVALSPGQKSLYFKLIGLLRVYVESFGQENFNRVHTMFVWNWPTWHRILLKIARATDSAGFFDENDCWFSTFSFKGPIARPKIHVVPGQMQSFRDTSAKDPSQSIRLKFTQVEAAPRFKSSVARLLMVFLHGSPPTETSQCSHLCKNDPQRCFNPYHTIWEEDLDNKSRNGCIYGSQLYCPHSPKCIFTDVSGRFLPHRNIDKLEICECTEVDCHAARIQDDRRGKDVLEEEEDDDFAGFNGDE